MLSQCYYEDCNRSDFLSNGSNAATFYTCFIESALITKRRTEIKPIEGIHLLGKNYNVVQGICFNKNKNETVIEYFPRNLKRFFPRLIGLYIDNCGLKEISCDDLRGLEALEFLGLSFNLLTSLPNDLFTNMPKLKVISFCGNKLRYLS